MKLECIEFSFDEKDHCWLEYTNKHDYLEDKTCDACGSAMEDFVFITNQNSEIGLTTGICESCGYIKRTKNLSPSTINSHFSDRWLKLRESGDFKENGSVYKAIKPFLTGHEKTVLDIGCGNGDQLITFANNQFQTFGVEPSVSRSDTAKNNLPNSNITNGFSQDFLREDKKRYDIVYIENVLQFVENPFELIDLAIDHLEDNGVLYIKAQRFEWSNFAMFSLIAIIRSYLDLYSLRPTIKEHNLNILRHDDFPFILVLKKSKKLNQQTMRILNDAVKVDKNQIEKVVKKEFMSVRSKILGNVLIKNKAMNRKMRFKVVESKPVFPIKLVAEQELPIILK